MEIEIVYELVTVLSKSSDDRLGKNAKIGERIFDKAADF